MSDLPKELAERLRQEVKAVDASDSAHATVQTVFKFINETEGKRPRINDPRAEIKIQNLTGAELKKQAEATEAWAEQLLKKP